MSALVKFDFRRRALHPPPYSRIINAGLLAEAEADALPAHVNPKCLPEKKIVQ